MKTLMPNTINQNKFRIMKSFSFTEQVNDCVENGLVIIDDMFMLLEDTILTLINEEDSTYTIDGSEVEFSLTADQITNVAMPLARFNYEQAIAKSEYVLNGGLVEVYQISETEFVSIEVCQVEGEYIIGHFKDGHFTSGNDCYYASSELARQSAKHFINKNCWVKSDIYNTRVTDLAKMIAHRNNENQLAGETDCILSAGDTDAIINYLTDQFFDGADVPMTDADKDYVQAVAEIMYFMLKD